LPRGAGERVAGYEAGRRGPLVVKLGELISQIAVLIAVRRTGLAA
jgi:hypothetical protein